MVTADDYNHIVGGSTVFPYGYNLPQTTVWTHLLTNMSNLGLDTAIYIAHDGGVGNRNISFVGYDSSTTTVQMYWDGDNTYIKVSGKHVRDGSVRNADSDFEIFRSYSKGFMTGLVTGIQVGFNMEYQDVTGVWKDALKGVALGVRQLDSEVKFRVRGSNYCSLRIGDKVLLTAVPVGSNWVEFTLPVTSFTLNFNTSDLLFIEYGAEKSAFKPDSSNKLISTTVGLIGVDDPAVPSDVIKTPIVVWEHSQVIDGWLSGWVKYWDGVSQVDLTVRDQNQNVIFEGKVYPAWDGYFRILLDRELGSGRYDSTFVIGGGDGGGGGGGGVRAGGEDGFNWIQPPPVVDISGMGLVEKISYYISLPFEIISRLVATASSALGSIFGGAGSILGIVSLAFSWLPVEISSIIIGLFSVYGVVAVLKVIRG